MRIWEMTSDPFGFHQALSGSLSGKKVKAMRAVYELPGGKIGITPSYPHDSKEVWDQIRKEAESQGHKFVRMISDKEARKKWKGLT